MTEKRTQAGWFGRQLARLRLAEPLRPRWWRFAPHALLAVALVPMQFFYTALHNTGRFPYLEPFCIALFFGLPMVLIPASLLRALWLWLQLGSRRGAIWLLHPALLGLAFLVLASPLRRWGKTWDFERRLSERNEAVRLILSAHPEPLPEGATFIVELPEGFRHLSHTGKVLIQGAHEATVVSFPLIEGDYEYSTGESKWRTPADGWYDGHWRLSTR